MYMSDFHPNGIPCNLFINDVFAPVPLSPINPILYSAFTLDSFKLGILYTNVSLQYLKM